MTEPIAILAVAGTHAKMHEVTVVQWYQSGHPLFRYLLRWSFCWLIAEDGRTFEWTTRLTGHQVWKRGWNWVKGWFGKAKSDWALVLIDWEVAGANLYAFVCPPLWRRWADTHWLPRAVTHLWLHSHGGNVGFFACAKGLRCNTFVTFCTPARSDMVKTIKQARANMGYWIEVHSDLSDLVQIAGEFGDGDLEIVRSFNELVDPETGKTLKELGLGPDDTVFVDDGHSMILNDEARFDRLSKILDVTKARHGHDELFAA